MKYIGTIISILLFSGFTHEAINYMPKMLEQELVKKYEGKSYKLIEITIPDQILQEKNIKGKFFKIVIDSTITNFVYVGRVNSCRADGCRVNESPFTKSLQYEYFDYYIMFSNNNQVESVRVYNYAATHGQEICSKQWLKQFIGYTGNTNLTIGKTIDGISGATISTNAIATDIQLKTMCILEINGN